MCASAGFQRRTSRSTLVALVMAGLAVGGCATRESIQLPDLSSWETRQAWLVHADDWELSGRIGVRTRDDGFNGKLRWRQDGDVFVATVGGPLGIGTVRIAGEDERVVVTDNDGERTVFADIERDLYLRYGWTIPVDSLRYWALGIPDPSLPAMTELNEEGQLARLEQGDWVVSISHYRDGPGARMPFRLSAESDATRVRIVIDDWYFYD